MAPNSGADRQRKQSESWAATTTRRRDHVWPVQQFVQPFSKCWRRRRRRRRRRSAAPTLLLLPLVHMPPTAHDVAATLSAEQTGLTIHLNRFWESPTRRRRLPLQAMEGAVPGEFQKG